MTKMKQNSNQISLYMNLIKIQKLESRLFVKGNVVRTNVYHKYIKDLKLNITIDLDGFIY